MYFPMMCAWCECTDADFVRGLNREPLLGQHWSRGTECRAFIRDHSKISFLGSALHDLAGAQFLCWLLQAASQFAKCSSTWCCLVACHDRDSSPKAIPCWSTDACLARCFGSVRFATATTGCQSPSDIRRVSSPAKQAPLCGRVGDTFNCGWGGCEAVISCLASGNA